MTDQTFENVSKFYGGPRRKPRLANLPPGITPVGPNGSGKTTLMNLRPPLQPSHGRISVLGIEPDDAYAFFRAGGYCTQLTLSARPPGDYRDSRCLGNSKMDAVPSSGRSHRTRASYDGHAQNRRYSKGIEKIRLRRPLRTIPEFSFSMS